LSRTQHQHIAGTRCANDFLETPSQLMENFFWDYRVATQFAKHYSTRQPIDTDYFKGLAASRFMSAGIDTQSQIAWALLDMKLHGPHPLPGSIMDIYKDLRNKYTLVPYVEGTYWPGAFGHLECYAAFYYSYLSCSVYSVNIWRKLFMNDPLRREAGERYRRELLQYGGSKDPEVLLQNLLGSSPSVDLFIQHLESV
jgi:intermediate peptidase